MENIYRPYFDPDFDTLIERIHPPQVCVDNDTCEDCTLVKVDSKNRHGILLEMVQVLTDLDLIISKSYISSDGGWFMDVFHVTDQLGNKLTDESLILHIQQALCPATSGGIQKQAQSCIERSIRPRLVSTDQTTLEITGIDRPGLLSEVAAVLAQLHCHVTSAVAWTHNTRAACIIYVEDEANGGPITDPKRMAEVEEQLESVVEAHHYDGERRSVSVTAPAATRTHTERRLHQLMSADKDCETCSSSCGDGEIQVLIENCKEKGYSMVNVRSRDRPKLLFDTVCTLTDMQYVVFHAAVRSKGSGAFQEYYIRHMDGCILDTESERSRVTQCLIAAIERRVSHGLRLDVCTRNRLGLLSDITRVFRENSLTIKSAEIRTRGERAIGSFYVTDASGNEVDPNTVESVKKQIGGTALAVTKSPAWVPLSSPPSTQRSPSDAIERPRFSLGSLLWSQFERLSGNLGLISS